MGLKDLFSSNTREAIERKYKKELSLTASFEERLSSLSDDELKESSLKLKERVIAGEDLSDVLPEAFAHVRESAKRSLSQRHYDVQIIGGIVLHRRGIAEMRTGEGKTLVATLPAYLNALTGKGVHLVTVNDYLARRDAVWMGEIYNRLGLSVGIINDQQISYLYDPTHKEEDKEKDQVGAFKVVYEFLRPASRKEAYQADITYGTNSQFGFDYLRDNLATDPEKVVQRGHNFAVVDEVDSILIDEARTPLIISAPAEESGDFYKIFSRIANSLKQEEDYTVDEKHRSISLTESGINKAEELLGVSDIYSEKGIKYVHHLETAVRAKALFQKDKDYVVKEGKIIIVDAFTGRLQPGRRWSEGLHQAIEAKEGAIIERESKTVASITYQNYFKLYEKLSGMTGTALTSKEEFYKVYGLDVVPIPTNVTPKRIDRTDLIFQTEKGKWEAIAKKTKELNEKGQPVLIGTISIEKSELLSAHLNKSGIKHTVLNAKNHEREGEIISEAGRKGSVMVATNMAGRGVDIKLGGPEGDKEKAEEIKSLGGLFVIGTERHEARRIDNQLRGRSGRQGDPGETQFFVSLEDELMRVFASDKIKTMMGRFGIPEDVPIQNSFVSKALEGAQARIEGFHFDARKHTLEYDNVLNQQRKAVYERRKKMLSAKEVEIEDFFNDFISKNGSEVEEIFEEKIKETGRPALLNSFRRVVLYVTDLLWMEHLETMDYLRSSVNLRAYGQKDPLVEYKKEGLRLYKDMEMAFVSQVTDLIKGMKVEKPRKEGEAVPVEVKKPEQVAGVEGGAMKNVGRNDPCPCGSGKKYKKCHGA
jgi:preprotein translocase subunit SecA